MKSTARLRRGKGIRRRVQGPTCLPGNWNLFLREDDNKTELFQFLAEELTNHHFDNSIVSTCGKQVVHNLIEDGEEQFLCPCNHEEADTRHILHLYDIGSKGSQSAAVRTVDTDVLVLTVSFFQQLGLLEIWIIL